MKTEEVTTVAKCDLDRRLKPGDKGPIGVGKLLEAPIAHGIKFALTFGVNRLSTRFLSSEQPGIRVAHYHRAAELAQACNDLSRLGAALYGVAKTHNLVNGFVLDVVDDGVKCNVVAMHI